MAGFSCTPLNELNRKAEKRSGLVLPARLRGSEVERKKKVVGVLPQAIAVCLSPEALARTKYCDVPGWPFLNEPDRQAGRMRRREVLSKLFQPVSLLPEGFHVLMEARRCTSREDQMCLGRGEEEERPSKVRRQACKSSTICRGSRHHKGTPQAQISK